MSLLHDTDAAPYTEFVKGGGVPGGHHVITRPDRETALIPPMGDRAKVGLRHDDVVVDIGAYVGTYTLRAARLPVRKVFAFEPTPQTFNVLQRNVAELPNVRLCPWAVVGDEHRGTTAGLHISKGLGVTNSIAKARTKSWTLQVPVIPYALAVHAATVLKIDVEGLEYTYRPFIRYPKLRALILEFHPISGVDWMGQAELIMDEIESHGFIPEHRPTFASGWSLTGVWIREPEVPSLGETCTPLMRGDQCCGCGAVIQDTPPEPQRALCHTCWGLWHHTHRKGFHHAQLTRQDES